MRRRRGLPGSGLELAVMQALWEAGEATVAGVLEALGPQRGLAPTTVATTLRRLEAKGLVTHRTQGRQYVYRPAVEARDVRRSLVRDLTERLFGGDPAALVHHLLAERDLAPGDLQRIRSLLAQQGPGSPPEETPRRRGRESDAP